MNQLQNKVAIITGGAGGIGTAAGRLFTEAGAKVLLVDLEEDLLREAAFAIDSGNIGYCVADVSTVRGNELMVAQAVDLFGGVDVLLANAGIEGQVREIVECDAEAFDRVISVNVRGPWLGIRAVIPEMRRRGGGSIVITSSVAGLRGFSNLTAYSTSKHAVVGLMRSAARELAGANIRVNTVHPSPVETRMMRTVERELMPDDPEFAHGQIASSIPMGRYGTPEEIARVMRFLASDDASWVTGSTYAVDGGDAA